MLLKKERKPTTFVFRVNSDCGSDGTPSSEELFQIKVDLD
jgi:hypothetical protein